MCSELQVCKAWALQGLPGGAGGTGRHLHKPSNSLSVSPAQSPGGGQGRYPQAARGEGVWGCYANTPKTQLDLRISLTPDDKQSRYKVTGHHASQRILCFHLKKLICHLRLTDPRVILISCKSRADRNNTGFLDRSPENTEVATQPESPPDWWERESGGGGSLICVKTRMGPRTAKFGPRGSAQVVQARETGGP